jgi:hypothetical protein
VSSNGQQKAWLNLPICLKLKKTRAFSSIMSAYLPKTRKRGFGILVKKTKETLLLGSIEASAGMKYADACNLAKGNINAPSPLTFAISPSFLSMGQM